MSPESRRGFTLIELLTVIAIIALLAALSFPVFNRVRENTRQTSCMANMRDLYVAANLYKQDNEEYPVMLLGYAQDANGLPTSSPTAPVEAKGIRNSPLFPAYVKSIETFHCPDNTDNDQRRVVTAGVMLNGQWQGEAKFGALGFKYDNTLPEFTGANIPFYAYDSYGVSAAINLEGKRVNNPATNQPGYQVVYARDWTGTTGRADASNQLKYARTAPPDRTILTWCNYHAATAGGDKCPVVLASGSAKVISFKQLAEKGFNALGE